MKEIPLTQGKVALVDDDMYDEIVALGNWFVNNGYALRYIATSGRKKYYQRMHHLILPMIEGLEVDHIDCNKANNQRSNLRYVSNSENRLNKKLQKNNTTGYKGIVRAQGKWKARIAIDSVRRNLGYFNTKEEAAMAYDEAAKKLSKAIRLNFPSL